MKLFFAALHLLGQGGDAARSRERRLEGSHLNGTVELVLAHFVEDPVCISVVSTSKHFCSCWQAAPMKVLIKSPTGLPLPNCVSRGLGRVRLALPVPCCISIMMSYHRHRHVCKHRPRGLHFVGQHIFDDAEAARGTGARF